MAGRGEFECRSAMVPAIREPALTIWSFRLAVIGALALSLTVSACGRKGPLDPPPRAQAQPANSASPQQQQVEGVDQYGNPPEIPEPRGQRKSFPLDWLLN